MMTDADGSLLLVFLFYLGLAIGLLGAFAFGSLSWEVSAQIWPVA